MTLPVVVAQVLRKISVNDLCVLGERIEALILYGPIESFEMRVVVGTSDTRMAVFNLRSLGECPGELTAVVRLEHLDREGRCLFHPFQETQRRPRSRPLACPRMREAGAHVEAREHVHHASVPCWQVNGIHLHQIARMLGIWARRRYVSTPVPALLQEVVPVERTLHRREGNNDSFFLERKVNHLGRTLELEPLL